MNEDEKQGAVLIVGLLLAIFFMKTGIAYALNPLDYFAVVVITVGILFVSAMYLKRFFH